MDLPLPFHFFKFHFHFPCRPRSTQPPCCSTCRRSRGRRRGGSQLLVPSLGSRRSQGAGRRRRRRRWRRRTRRTRWSFCLDQRCSIFILARAACLDSTLSQNSPLYLANRINRRYILIHSISQFWFGYSISQFYQAAMNNSYNPFDCPALAMIGCRCTVQCTVCTLYNVQAMHSAHFAHQTLCHFCMKFCTDLYTAHLFTVLHCTTPLNT